MKLRVLFGMRKSDDPLPPEALAVITGYDDDENPRYLNDEYEKADRSHDFAALRIIDLLVSERDILVQLKPPPKIVDAEVIK